MRRYALLTAAFLCALHAFSQNVYIRYDVSCMDKYEYRFVENANSVDYTAYRMPNTAGDFLFFETGPRIIAFLTRVRIPKTGGV